MSNATDPLILQRKLPQDRAFDRHCKKVPKPFSLEIKISHHDSSQVSFIRRTDGTERKGEASTTTYLPEEIQPSPSSSSSSGVTSHSLAVQVPTPKPFLPDLEDSLMTAAAAWTGPRIPHLLDGYSFALITRIVSDKDSTIILVEGKPVQGDLELFHREVVPTTRLSYGIFSGDTPWWQKLFCCGRFWKLAATCQIIEKNTAHQPIFYPSTSETFFAAPSAWPSFKVHWPEENVHQLSIEENPDSWLSSSFPPNHHTCMHPLYDSTHNQLLTYSFEHSLVRHRTLIYFYAFDGAPGASVPEHVTYEVADRIALHMFGFTQNYYIIFGNTLQLESCGNCKLIYGAPILRAATDHYCGDLVIHFIPRHGRDHLQAFSVNTRQQGNCYHAINCFETNKGADVVVDVFISKLNPVRESSQFELDPNWPVFDNEGDPFRFLIHTPLHPDGAGVVGSKLISSDVDSAIDFHCVNPRYLGNKHRCCWLVTHVRHREQNIGGAVEVVESVLRKIEVKPKTNSSPLDFDPTTTVTASKSSMRWNKLKNTCYLRTPLFVAHAGATKEDDGQLFTWSYDTIPKTHADHLRAFILIFSAQNLESLIRVAMPSDLIVPYSVHSAIYSRHMPKGAPPSTPMRGIYSPFPQTTFQDLRSSTHRLPSSSLRTSSTNLSPPGRSPSPQPPANNQRKMQRQTSRGSLSSLPTVRLLPPHLDASSSPLSASTSPNVSTDSYSVSFAEDGPSITMTAPPNPRSNLRRSTTPEPVSLSPPESPEDQDTDGLRSKSPDITLFTSAPTSGVLRNRKSK